MVENLERTGAPPIPAGEIGPREPNGSHSDQRLLAAPSDHAITSAEERLASEHRVEITRNRAEQINAEREIETQLDWFRQRAAKQDAERRAQEAEQLQRQVQAAAQREREQWRARWIRWGMERRPWNIPQQAELDVERNVSEVLQNLSPGDPEDVVRRLVMAAADKALAPWVDALASKKAIEKALDDGCFGFRDDLRNRARQAAVEALGKIRPGATREEREGMARAAVQEVKREWEHSQTIQAVVSACIANLQGANGEDREEAQELIQAALAGVAQGSSRRALKRAAAEALEPFRAAIEERQAQARAEQARKEDQAMRKALLDSVKGILIVRSLPLDALKDVEDGLSKLPTGAPKQEMERVGTSVIERYRKKRERAIAKRGAIEAGMRQIYPTLQELEKDWKFDRPASQLAEELTPAIRTALEEELDGDETAEDLSQIVRELIEDELDLDD